MARVARGRDAQMDLARLEAHTRAGKSEHVLSHADACGEPGTGIGVGTNAVSRFFGPTTRLSDGLPYRELLRPAGRHPVILERKGGAVMLGSSVTRCGMTGRCACACGSGKACTVT